MGFIKRKRYYFSDTSIAIDTIISYCLVVPCLIMELVSVICSIVTAGNVPEIFGLLYLCSIIMSVSGLVFACFGLKAQEGGVSGKKLSIFLSILSLVIMIIFWFSGK